MNNTEFEDRKLTGDKAEAIARTHFERLGYAVQGFGVERLLDAEPLAILYKSRRSPHISKELVELLRSLPDFIVSQKQAVQNRKPGQTNGFLVEVKFRRHVRLNNSPEPCVGHVNFQTDETEACGHPMSLHMWSGERFDAVECLGCQYRSIIEFGKTANGKHRGNVLFYLVTENGIMASDGSEKSFDDKIVVNLAYSPEWWRSSVDTGLKALDIYIGNRTNFVEVAKQLEAEM